MLDELIENGYDNETIFEIRRQIERIKQITSKLENITTYETKDYIQGTKIIDLDKASYQCPIE
jgi:hypothetical protein